MAIDTQQKRQSSVAVTLPFKTERAVPTGTITAQERVAAAWQYSGLFAGAVSLGDVPDAPAERTFFVSEQWREFAVTPHNREFWVRPKKREFKAEAA